jgi:hypothetical protein
MKNMQAIADKTAISLSLLCAIHCLAMPFLLVLVPAMTAINLADESFHLWMLIAVIPTSLMALTLGCKKHKRYRLFILATSGLSLMILAAWLGHDLLGESGEIALTAIGASIIAVGHYLNHRLCQSSRYACHPEITGAG